MHKLTLLTSGPSKYAEYDVDSDDGLILSNSSKLCNAKVKGLSIFY